MPRYKATIEYNGTFYYGSQIQNHNSNNKSYITVVEDLQQAIFNFSQQKVNIVSAGRTDAKVHAKGQVVHFDLQKSYQPYQVMAGLNFHLKASNIVILQIIKATKNFHARFSAKERSYEYIIQNRSAPALLLRNRCWHIRDKLDLQIMKLGATLFIGKHDFSSFRNSECQAKSAIKVINDIKITKKSDLIIIKVKAPSFLHNQIRIIVGTLVELGKGKLTIAQIQDIFAKKDRSFAGPTAPACGLYFMRVRY